MNTREKARAWLVIARTTRGLLAPKATPIEIITALLAEREALIAEIDECVMRSNENLMPWDELQPFVYCETLNEILDKWRTK